MPVDQAGEERGAVDPGQGRLQPIIDRDGGDRRAVDGQRLQHALSGGSETGERFPHQARAHSLREQGGRITAAVGGARQTICLWRLHSPLFQAEINRRRNELWESATDKLRALIPKALAMLERELDGGDHCGKAAGAVVKMAGLPLHNIGAQDPDAMALSICKGLRQTEFL